MEDKEVQMALYGVSIAIVTHYEDILLAMKLGKQTEAENTIKKIISLISIICYREITRAEERRKLGGDGAARTERERN